MKVALKSGLDYSPRPVRPSDASVTSGSPITLTLPADCAGQRLDQALSRLLPQFSRSRLKKLIETGQVSSEGATINDPSLRVKAGQSFVVDLPAPTKVLIALTVDYRYLFISGVIGLVLLAVAVYFWSRTEEGGVAFDRLKFRLPVVGDTLLKFHNRYGSGVVFAAVSNV